MGRMIKNTHIASLHNDYYLLFKMMMLALNTEDVTEGMKKSLYLLKLFLDCGDIVLHKKNAKGIYVFLANQARMSGNSDTISCIVNKTSTLTEHKKTLHINLDFSEEFQNISLIHIKTDNEEYILSINNYDIDHINEGFKQELLDALKVILKRNELHEHNMRAINTDILTGLDNRTSYEERIERINQETETLVFGLFDLFRLKYVNDNYSHAVGDRYIQETGKILRKYWPKYTFNLESYSSKKSEKTGHCMYRIGGDEFVLITTENIKLTQLKASLASQEVEMIDLGENIDIPIGLNTGIVLLNPEEPVRQAYEEADRMMSKDKNKMYIKYNLDRRQ